MSIEIGKIYFGPGEQRLRAISVDGDQVRVQFPLSLNEKTISLQEMLDFIAGSKRRTYHRETEDGIEIRTKIEAFTVRKKGDRSLPRGKYVTYITPAKERHTIPAADWQEWRAGAPQ